MSSPVPVPRYHLGEVAYQLLWAGIVLLPLVAGGLRALTTPGDVVFALYALVGIPATVAMQAMAAMLASTYRRRQWRHWLGPVGAWTSFAYYGLWILLVLTIPDGDPGDPIQSVFSRIFGVPAAEAAVTVLLIAIGLAYLTLLVAIRVEGERALARWGEAGDVSVGGEQLGQ